MTDFLLELGIASTYFLSGALSLAIVLLCVHLARTMPAPVYRCQHCDAELAAWDLLLTHEEAHA